MGVSQPPRGLPSGVVQAGVVLFNCVLTGLNPHRKTNTERIRKGIHACKVRPAEYVCISGPVDPPETLGIALPACVTAIGPPSSSNRHIRFGFQKSRNSTVQSRENSPAVISTRLLSILLDQKNCMEAKEMPTTRIAGRTSNVSFHETMARTSQNGTMMAVKGKMRPIMAFMSASGSWVTVASMWTGVPMAPQATGEIGRA